MLKKFISFLYVFDFIGTTPRLFIFKSDRYKTFFSSFSSIVIILFSLIFTILSIVEYFKFENPNIVYAKSSDDLTEREIFIKDTFLMFQLIETTSNNIINDSIAYFEGNYRIIYDNGKYGGGDLYIEKCEFGKNIDLKYVSILKSKLNFGRPIETFYCISLKNGNVSVFYKPNIGYSLINLEIILKNNSYYIPEKIQTLIICQNNVIDHNNKNKPINESFIYHQTSSFNSIEFTNTEYIIQYIKYESDNGFFYKNNKIFNGISFNNMISYRKFLETYDLIKDLENKNISKIGSISFLINKPTYDYYKRSYQKLQSLLAEIMSVVSLVFEIGKQISFIMCDKKMSQKIIKTLLDKETILTQLNYKKTNFNNKSNDENKLSSERNKIHNKLIDKKSNTDFSESKSHSKLNITKDFNNLSKSELKRYKSINNRVFKKINFYHILKSYFCFKDKKTQLINICHSIIEEDLCIEKILERFYNFEKLCHFITSKEKRKIESLKIKRFKEIKQFIYKINDEIKRENSINKDEAFQNPKT